MLKEYRNKLGELHRTDGPAYEDDHIKSWWINGLRHRTDGPAVELSNGNKYWFINNKRHREDGPAVDNHNDDKYWYLNDIEYSEEEYQHELTKIKLKRLIELWKNI